MKKCVLFLLVLSLGCVYGSIDDFRPLSPISIVMDAHTKEVLFKKKEKLLRSPASISKLATVLYFLKIYEGSLRDIVEVVPEMVRKIDPIEKMKSYESFPPYIIDNDGGTISLKPHEKISVEELIDGALIASANDAANMLAYIGGKGDVSLFMSGVNEYLHSIGLDHTTLQNPSGLTYPGHLSCAYDLALLGIESLNNSVVRESCYKKAFIRDGCEEDSVRNTNKNLREGRFFSDEIIGLKTGYTAAAGYTLLSCAQRDGRCLIAVFLGGESKNDRFCDAIEAFDLAYKKKGIERLLYECGTNVLYQGEKYQTDAPLAVLEYDPESEYFPQIVTEDDGQHLIAIRNGIEAGRVKLNKQNIFVTHYVALVLFSILTLVALFFLFTYFVSKRDKSERS